MYEQPVRPGVAMSCTNRANVAWPAARRSSAFGNFFSHDGKTLLCHRLRHLAFDSSLHQCRKNLALPAGLQSGFASRPMKPHAGVTVS